MPPLEFGYNVSLDSPEFELRGVEHQLGVMERYRAARGVGEHPPYNYNMSVAYNHTVVGLAAFQQEALALPHRQTSPLSPFP